MNRHWTPFKLLVAATLLLTMDPGWASSVAGTIKGTVLDDAGLTLPGALVTIRSPGLIGGIQERNAAEDGSFTFQELPPGSYEVIAELQGFGTVTKTGVEVQVGRVTTVTFELQPGGSAVVLPVEKMAVDPAAQSTVMTSDFLSRIPTGRAYQDAIGMAAGVMGGGNPNSAGGSYNENTIIGTGEGYRNAGVNRTTLTREDPLSTFATDVDTGSFTLARRMLMEERRLPNPDGVRVEEFINYPKWSYPTPDVAKTDSPVAVTLEAAPHPWQSGHHLLRVGLRADDMKGERAPANLVFLVDVSGSMQGQDRLPRARVALHTLVDSLGPADSVALVTYAGSTRVVLGTTSGANKAHIHAGIDGLASGGGTSMGAGIDLAYELAKASQRDGTETRVIVLSDGDANIGNRTPEALLEQIEQYAGTGITLSTIGFGVGNYQDAMMEQFANKGDGNYYYIDSLDEAERVFTQNLAGTIQTIARDVKVQVAFDPATVHAWRLVGYENRDVADEDFRKDEVDGGEMGSGQRVTVLYDVVLEGNPKGQTPLATVSFRAKQPGKESPAKEWKTTMNASAIHKTFEAASDEFRAAVGIAGFAEVLRGSQYAGELSLDQVADILKAARRLDRDDGEVEEMVAKASAMWRGTQASGR